MSVENPRSDAFYDAALLAASAGFLVHLAAAVGLGGVAVHGVVLWPLVTGLCLMGGRWPGRAGAVTAVTAAQVAASSLAVGGAPLTAVSAAVAGALVFVAVGRAEAAMQDDLQAESDRAAKLVGDLRRLEATRRKFQERSTKVQVGGASGSGRFGRRSVNEGRAVYRFQRNVLAGLLEARRVEGVAQVWQAAAGDLGVAQGLVVLFDPDGRARLGTSWGVEAPSRALAGLVLPGGAGFVQWALDHKAIVEAREASTHPRLEEARRRFSALVFPPSLVVPVHVGDQPVMALVLGPQRSGALPALRPTLISPLLDVQAQILDLLLNGAPVGGAC